jgi:hypothetical protein
MGPTINATATAAARRRFSKIVSFRYLAQVRRTTITPESRHAGPQAPSDSCLEIEYKGLEEAGLGGKSGVWLANVNEAKNEQEQTA